MFRRRSSVATGLTINALQKPLPAAPHPDHKYDKRPRTNGSIALEMGSVLPFKQRLAENFPADSAPSLPHYTGLRGLLTILAWVHLFLLTFLPTTVYRSENEGGPTWQIIIRKSLSVLLWNGPLLTSFFIFISARTLLLKFMKNAEASTLASGLFRRTFTLGIPMALALAIVTGIEHNLRVTEPGFDEGVRNFTDRTNNLSILPAKVINHFIVYFNAVFTFFYPLSSNHSFFSQLANLAYPAQPLATLGIIYQQSFTLYMTAVVLPFTSTHWRRVFFFPLFILTAWWAGSWACFSLAGLYIADLTSDERHEFYTLAKRGLKLNLPRRAMVWRRGPSRILNVFIPTWLIAGAIFLAGLIMQYTYAGVSAPDSVIDAELLAHAPSLSYYDSTSTSYSFAADGSNLNPREPRPRVDNFLVVLGFILLIETLPLLQNGLANRVFMWLGKRSFSWLLIAPVVLHILGIRLALRTWDVEGWSFAAGVALSFPVCLIATVLVSDTWWRFIEMPTRRGVRGFWAWMIR